MIRFKDWGTCRELTCWFSGVVGVRDPEGRWIGEVCSIHALMGIKSGKLRPAEPGVVQEVSSFKFIAVM